MSRPVRVPDPVWERLERESEERDVSKGSIVAEWMDAADKLDRIEGDFLEAIETRGGEDE